MKYLLYSLLILFLLGQCKKVPERGFITIRPVSANGKAIPEGKGIFVDYGDDVDVLFTYSSDSPLDSIYIKLITTYNERISSSDDENITNHPKQGDKSGSFIYRVKTASQFDPPGGNPSFNSKGIRIFMLNQVGTVQETTLNVTVQ